MGDNAPETSAMLFPHEIGRLTEFNFNEPDTPFQIVTTPIVLASTVLLVDDVSDRVWVNADVDWQFSFGASGQTTVLFEILRDDTPIYSANQSITLTTNTFPTTMFQHAHLQHVDTTPVAAPVPTGVLYSVRATLIAAPAGTCSTRAPTVISAAEVERNR